MLLLAVLVALPDALLNRPYAPEPAWERAGTRCAMPIPVTRVVAGELPAGLGVSGRGAIQGTPTEPGLFRFTVELSDGCSRRLEQRQLRVMPAPILSVEAESLEFHCPQGAPAFSGGIVRVSGSAPGRAYSVDILDGAWLEATMREGVLPGEGASLESDTLRLSINPSKLAPGSYSARLRLSTWQGANAPELFFRLRVDSPQSIFGPIVASPSPIPIVYQIAEAPNAQSITPPHIAIPDPPRFPVYDSKRKPESKSSKIGARGPTRSRILPFPKVTIPPKPAAKPDDKDVKKTEAPPERTKPSAMPAPPVAAAKNEKPKAVH